MVSDRCLSVGDIGVLWSNGWIDNKSSAVAEMGDRGHNRHGPIRVGWKVRGPLCLWWGTKWAVFWIWCHIQVSAYAHWTDFLISTIKVYA